MILFAMIFAYFMLLACTVGTIGEMVAGKWVGAIGGCVPTSFFLLLSVLLTIGFAKGWK